MIKVAIDTNILFSSFVFGGNPRKLLCLAENHKIRLGIPKYCILEIESVFKDKLGKEADKHFQMLEEWVDMYAERISKPRNKIVNKYKDCTNDIWDLPVLASVVIWEPDFFVTGNHRSFNKSKVELYVKMVSTSELLSIFESAQIAT
ncbi:hypothetical protein SPSYN_00029 [Sporotomaculum syntrophicum]|uniref:PIN domain-containing protein n=1 Tax=Sporotomaculum syntrophicum TaxID=182264 RepID=A0A9D2WRI6_9FIRM|nr:PIN domain-containing protein [Sporotomaculum syntrophicum]KAF1086312.1 hypothetical protein SPSYN_00029 [Sporotomaculum syntrophicum]